MKERPILFSAPTGWDVASSNRLLQCGEVFTAHVRWTPSIFMPRWASRITLEIAEVRVQRLQEISDADALAEGVSEGLIPADEYGPIRIGYVFGPDDGKCALHPSATEAFSLGWDAINGRRAPLASDPWVWGLTFKVWQ